MDSYGHFIKYCLTCQNVISQCRCMACDKTVLFGVCDKCNEKGVPSPASSEGEGDK
jgi:hypothetical protein